MPACVHTTATALSASLPVASHAAYTVVLMLLLLMVLMMAMARVADYVGDVCQIIKTKTNTGAEAMLRNYKAVARTVCTW